MITSASSVASALSARSNTRELTLYYERRRAVCGGVVETAVSTFLLLIAVQYFQAGATAKGLIAAGHSIGFLLSPVTVYVVGRLRWRSSAAAAFTLVLAGVGFGVPALAQLAAPMLSRNVQQSLFVSGAMLALISLSCAVPLFTQIYQDNYPSDQRGRLFSTTLTLRIATAAVFAQFAGMLLSQDIEHFGWLMLIFCAAALCSGYCIAQCPSRALPPPEAGPFHALHWLRDDRAFRATLISWMLMGFANLTMLPMRVEYMANPRWGLALAPMSVALLNAVLPNIARLSMINFWGRIFDRMNFFWIRIVLNAGFALGILTFFCGDSIYALVVAALIFGISSAGGDVTWSLYVTKLAPPERVAEYMCVHTFLTGIRGVIAPLLAFHLLSLGLGFGLMAGLCAAMILLASLLMLPEARAFGIRGEAAARPGDLPE